jgi:hypothetical protein
LVCLQMSSERSRIRNSFRGVVTGLKEFDSCIRLATATFAIWHNVAQVFPIRDILLSHGECPMTVQASLSVSFVAKDFAKGVL